MSSLQYTYCFSSVGIPLHLLVVLQQVGDGSLFEKTEIFEYYLTFRLL